MYILHNLCKLCLRLFAVKTTFIVVQKDPRVTWLCSDALYQILE